MLFLMLVSLYTSRVILNALGVEDYGIYNVVGGVVTMFSMLSGSLSAAISRFITFELGTGDIEKLKKVFSASVTIQFGISLVFVVVAETIGIWFLNNKMEIPEGRLIAANWCLQFSIMTFVINLLCVPYNASIIAHEKMSAFAYISILDAVGKLVVAWCIALSPVDKLIFYGFLMALIAWIIQFIYSLYCKRHFVECSYKFIYDNDLLKQMFSFAGWNFFGAGSWQLMNQGVNLLLNIYFGVTLNAARGIATQVDHAVMNFVNNFTTAINPQITKSYASGNREYMFELLFRGAKFSYFLILLFAVPIICETHTMVKLWLKLVPEYAVIFIRLSILVSMIHILSNTMITAMLATGNIKKYQIIVGGLGMLVFPIAWMFFYLGYPPFMAYVSTLIIFIIQLICRLYLMRAMIGMSINRYLKEVLFRVLIVSVISFSLPLLSVFIFEQSIVRFVSVILLSIPLSTITIVFVGMSINERLFIKNQIMTKICKMRLCQ